MIYSKLINIKKNNSYVNYQFNFDDSLLVRFITTENPNGIKINEDFEESIDDIQIKKSFWYSIENVNNLHLLNQYPYLVIQLLSDYPDIKIIHNDSYYLECENDWYEVSQLDENFDLSFNDFILHTNKPVQQINTNFNYELDKNAKIIKDKYLKINKKSKVKLLYPLPNLINIQTLFEIKPPDYSNKVEFNNDVIIKGTDINASIIDLKYLNNQLTDDINKVKSNKNDIQNRLQKLEENINSLSNNLEDKVNNNNINFNELKEYLSKLENQFEIYDKKFNNKINSFDNNNDSIKHNIEKNNAVLSNLINKLEEKVSQTLNKQDKFQKNSNKQISNIENKLYNFTLNSVNNIQDKLVNLEKNKIDNTKSDELKNEINNLQNLVKNVGSEMMTAYKEIDKVKNTIPDVNKKELTEIIDKKIDNIEKFSQDQLDYNVIYQKLKDKLVTEISQNVEKQVNLIPKPKEIKVEDVINSSEFDNKIIELNEKSLQMRFREISNQLNKKKDDSLEDFTKYLEDKLNQFESKVSPEKIENKINEKFDLIKFKINNQLKQINDYQVEFTKKLTQLQDNQKLNNPISILEHKKQVEIEKNLELYQIYILSDDNETYPYYCYKIENNKSHLIKMI